jgi:peptide methionine sulfoxide reductase msrA/msrB
MVTCKSRAAVVASGLIAGLILLLVVPGFLQQGDARAAKYNPLTPEEERIIVHKGTEAPRSGEYNNHKEAGIYSCKRCDTPLFLSHDKFDSRTGWPSFDDTVAGGVREVRDADGRRTEIVCAVCDGHLGHVFRGENMTDKNTRHCVNSLSLKFAREVKTERAIFAGGCFWGVEHYLQSAPGVKSTTVGYVGGKTANPTYQKVLSKRTGHAEAVEVVYDPQKTSFETLARLFFEIHDPTQMNRQGPDIGGQYRSAVFFLDDEQKRTTEHLVGLLEDKGLKVATQVVKAGRFWAAEDYHQDYYAKTGKEPYCHVRTKRF